MAARPLPFPVSPLSFPAACSAAFPATSPAAVLTGRQEVGAEAACDAAGGVADRIAGEVGVAGGGLDLGVAEQPADHGQALAQRQGARREGVAYIMY